MTVVYFPAGRAVLAVDFIFPGTTPPVWGEYDWTPLREWIASIKTVEALDFDILIAGHGVQPGESLQVSTPRVLFRACSAEGANLVFPDFDVTRDGQRFIFSCFAQGSNRRALTVSVGWMQ
jgi:glyoxylase-like metal-dependent hydrolase (beta-lactamase superfamily II)